jgi:hypothetical protein
MMQSFVQKCLPMAAAAFCTSSRRAFCVHIVEFRHVGANKCTNLGRNRRPSGSPEYSSRSSFASCLWDSESGQKKSKKYIEDILDNI